MENAEQPSRLIICYELSEERRTQANLKALYAELDSLGAVQIQESVWIARTEMSVAYVSTKLRAYFGKKDRLLVAMLTGDYRNYGGNRDDLEPQRL